MAALAALPMIATVAAGGLQMIGTIQQGRAQKAAYNYQAEMDKRKGQEELAASQREAIDKRGEGDRLMSRQRAVAAASGGGVVNPTILDIFGDTAQQAEYNAQAQLYGGESRRRGALDQAALAKAKGQAAMRGSIFEGIGQGLGGLSKLNFG